MFLETIPDTSNYMIAGFVIAFATMGIYILSLILRNRNLERDLETLKSWDVQARPKATKPKKAPKAKSKSKPAKKK